MYYFRLTHNSTKSADIPYKTEQLDLVSVILTICYQEAAFDDYLFPDERRSANTREALLKDIRMGSWP